MDRPSSVPGISGFMEGYEGGAVAGGSVDGSGPSSMPASCEVACGGNEPGVVGSGPAFGGAPLSRGVYSVVS